MWVLFDDTNLYIGVRARIFLSSITSSTKWGQMFGVRNRSLSVKLNYFFAF